MAFNNVEILAPAGSVAGMQAAFRAGADACYIGGNLFGARAFADNPGEEDLLRAIDEAHVHGKKLYLTVNTLLTDAELQERLYDYMLPYYREGIDAVLVQDFGVLRFLHAHFPDLPLHASTQMTVTDTGSVDILKRYGITRIVPARELSLAEIRRFRDETDIETEVFIHGALCVCYSGQCLLSEYLGGRSGNRGRCAGPCRLPYTLTDWAGNRISDPGKPYLLSPKDLMTLEVLPDYIDAGVVSMKIEGRMKKPEYAALTSHIYRKWTDYYLEYGREKYESETARKERAEDAQNLMDLYNRGGFTEGYGKLHNSPSMMASVRPNHDGLRVGEVTDVRGSQMQIKASVRLNAQDVLEVRNRAGKSIYEFTLGEDVPVKGTFHMNSFRGTKVAPGFSVYRTRNNKLLNWTEETLMAPIRRPVNIDFHAVMHAPSILMVQDPEDPSLIVTTEGPVTEIASKSSVTENRVREALLKVGETSFRVENLNIQLPENAFLPMSALNAARRAALEAFEEEIVERGRRYSEVTPGKEVDEVMAGAGTCASDQTGKLPDCIVSVCDLAQLEALLAEPDLPDHVVPALDLTLFQWNMLPEAVKMAATAENAAEGLWLRLPWVLRRDVRISLMKELKAVTGLSERISGVLIRNLEELAFVKECQKEGLFSEDILLLADENFYHWNDWSRTFHQQWEIHASVARVYGRKELMLTAQCQYLNHGRCLRYQKEKQAGILHQPLMLVHENGKSFPVVPACQLCGNIIYSPEPDSRVSKEIDDGEVKLIRLTTENPSEIHPILRRTFTR